MTSYPTDWHQALAGVSGQLVRGGQRVATKFLRGSRAAACVEKKAIYFAQQA
jgi:hypothetical protein